jgi:hypothetical protein
MINNYRNLLRAIITQDDEETNSVICVYDTLENDIVVAVFGRSKYCAEYFNTTSTVIDADVSKKLLKKRRYRLERVKL